MLNLQRVIIGSCLLVAVSAFSAKKASQPIRSTTSTPSALNAGAVWMDGDEQDGIFLMSRAEACANSDSCSLEEAQGFLDDILHIQKECIGSALATNSAVCDNVDNVVEVVANLRDKIALKRKTLAPVRATVHLFNLAMGFYAVSTILHGFAAVPNVPVDAPMFSSFGNSFPMEGVVNTRGVTTILPQEWFWSIRDGYFPAMFTEWLQNGGLVVDVSAFDEKVVAFTPQEWVWSIQNGSFGRMLEENMRYGGFVVDSDFDTEGMTAMTPRDVLWSIQGGYFGTAMEHFYRNGGV
mmetsp:Transcript_79/g.203  ORF Transcript_79/g.203 Transcript_79/m.203 type:complete len:294 (+) Transcript_79:203-1084(+)|eukprot:CAMPEP_0168193452 /NCGR_PEP_ID=MMETSP0139_2-20121125/18616_1 /TAXON_ID=44445 /ORGANISM="Pseudo-nitzschia australis, Strain 10249 10 AB" /LENGTH=293 /DNA_ID=CAMNT_0008116813 /DNA_START=95 /DNA_END=976 /DNA_ORIENTATION=-